MGLARRRLSSQVAGRQGASLRCRGSVAHEVANHDDERCTQPEGWRRKPASSYYGALPTGFGEVGCPTRANYSRPRRSTSWSILLIMGVRSTYDLTNCVTKNHHVHTNTAAGNNTIIPPLWIRPSSLNWEEQQNNPHPTLSYPIHNPHSTYST